MFLFVIEAVVTCVTDITAFYLALNHTNFCIYSVLIFFAGVKQEEQMQAKLQKGRNS